MSELRTKRIESLLKEEIASMVTMGEVKDPRIDGLLTVSDVSISKDYRHAKVYVSYFGELERLVRMVEALNHAAGFIQGVLGKRIRLRTMPKLRFVVDESLERGFRMTQTLKNLST